MHRYICEKCFVEFTTKKIGQRFCSKSCANSFNTSNRKIQDISIFKDGINSISAYILGLILSDGCLSYDEHSMRYRITISMNDYEIIKFLRDKYCPTKKLYEYKHPRGKAKTYTFITTNEFDINFLRKLGLLERKSLIIEMPSINKKYYRHLIRGIFDGDGSVYKNKTTTKYNGVIKKYEYINASFTTGSYNFGRQLQDILKQNEINSTFIQDSRPRVSTWYVKINSKESMDIFYKYMYNNSKIYLLRKKIKFEMMI